MNELLELPNIGKILSEKLSQAGIKNFSQMQSLGSEKIFLSIRKIDDEACLDMLYAIEGAIRGIRWHHLPRERKAELKEFFDALDQEKILL